MPDETTGEVAEDDPSTDALDEAAECIAKGMGELMAGLAARIGKPASEIGMVKKRAQLIARRIAYDELEPFYPRK